MRFSIVFFMFLLIYNKDAVASLLSPCLTLKITIRDFGCQNPAFPTLDADSQSITTRFPTLHSVGNPALLQKKTIKPYTWKSLIRSSPDPCIATQLQYQKSYHTLVRSVPCFGTHRTTAWYYGYHCSLTILSIYIGNDHKCRNSYTAQCRKIQHNLLTVSAKCRKCRISALLL